MARTKPTSIVIPQSLKEAVQRCARAQGVTLTDFTLRLYREAVGERVVYDPPGRSEPAHREVLGQVGGAATIAVEAVGAQGSARAAGHPGSSPGR
jgi:hypothetical protein